MVVMFFAGGDSQTFFERYRPAIISVLTILGLVSLIVLIGAIYGYTITLKTMISYNISKDKTLLPVST